MYRAFSSISTRLICSVLRLPQFAHGGPSDSAEELVGELLEILSDYWVLVPLTGETKRKVPQVNGLAYY